ncbi:MAG: DNA replication/repair protein RecF [Lachnospiraceae bacterium]|nr:DNA replication/repair protein RecF [Lachnospiraceae bacterium]
MVIHSLELQNFRNYREMQMDFSQGVNIFYGDNAQGKTNILEAIFVGATARSHRAGRDREMILFGKEEAHIKYFVEKRGITDRIDMHLKKNRAKGIALNGVPLRRASDLFGSANVVFFSPEDLNIIKDGPSERRKFMDTELCQLDRVYMNHLANYNKVVMQRNKLLKELEFHGDYLDTLQVWDEQLVRYGREVIRRRQEFVAQLEEIIRGIHGAITAGREEIRVSYEPSVCEDQFESELIKNRARDLRARATLSGPHRDDLAFMLGEIDIRTFGSQGQQRTAALSLKLSEIEIVKKRTNDCPVLLLDDVLSELDGSRQEKLLDSIQHVQTLLTCTGVDAFVKKRFPVNRIFRVTQGTIQQEN